MILSAVATRGVMHCRIVDLPDHARKMHHAATPSSGGIAIVIGFGLSLALAFWLHPELQASLSRYEARQIALLLFLSAALFLLGVWDDIHALPAKPKFLTIAILCGLFAWSGTRIEALPLTPGFSLQLGAIIGVMGTVLWLFTLTNAVNFMDGANGLALGCTTIALGWLGIACCLFGSPWLGLFAFSLAGAQIGFLYWNFPSGRIFAGDAGALFSGFCCATCALLAVNKGVLSVYAAPVLLFPLLADVLLTLAWRLSRRQNLLAAHHDHHYQLLLRRGLSVRTVTPLFWGLTFNCGLLAVGTHFLGPWRDLGAALVLAVVAGGAIWISRSMHRAFEETSAPDGIATNPGSAPNPGPTHQKVP